MALHWAFLVQISKDLSSLCAYHVFSPKILFHTFCLQYLWSTSSRHAPLSSCARYLYYLSTARCIQAQHPFYWFLLPLAIPLFQNHHYSFCLQSPGAWTTILYVDGVKGIKPLLQHTSFPAIIYLFPSFSMFSDSVLLRSALTIEWIVCDCFPLPCEWLQLFSVPLVVMYFLPTLLLVLELSLCIFWFWFNLL